MSITLSILLLGTMTASVFVNRKTAPLLKLEEGIGIKGALSMMILTLVCAITARFLFATWSLGPKVAFSIAIGAFIAFTVWSLTHRRSITIVSWAISSVPLLLNWNGPLMSVYVLSVVALASAGVLGLFNLETAYFFGGIYAIWDIVAVQSGIMSSLAGGALRSNIPIVLVFTDWITQHDTLIGLADLIIASLLSIMTDRRYGYVQATISSVGASAAAGGAWAFLWMAKTGMPCSAVIFVSFFVITLITRPKDTFQVCCNMKRGLQSLIRQTFNTSICPDTRWRDDVGGV